MIKHNPYSKNILSERYTEKKAGFKELIYEIS